MARRPGWQRVQGQRQPLNQPRGVHAALLKNPNAHLAANRAKAEQLIRQGEQVLDRRGTSLGSPATAGSKGTSPTALETTLRQLGVAFVPARHAMCVASSPSTLKGATA